MGVSLKDDPQGIYRQDIDGLRAIAVVGVVIFHAFPSVAKGGFVGVDVFFVISGFLISGIIVRALEAGRFSFVEFYMRRVLRIFPALVFVLLVCIVFGWIALLADEYKQLGKHVLGGAGFVSNLVLLGESGYFDERSELKPLLHLWSLGIEEQFYIIWPIFLACAFKKNRFLVFILSLIVASFSANILVSWSNSTGAFYLPVTRFWELLCGAVIAVGRWNRRCSFKRSANNVLSFVGAFFLILCILFVPPSLSFIGTSAVMSTSATVLLIVAGPGAWFNRRILASSLLTRIGLISYPLYLWHWPLLSFVMIINGERPSVVVLLALVLGAFVLAWLTYMFVERPLRFGGYPINKCLSLMCTMLMIAFMGAAIWNADGFGMRTAVRSYEGNAKELIRTESIDAECVSYFGLRSSPVPYCRYVNGNGSRTVALFGDSHAHAAFPGIADLLKAGRVNTVLLGTSDHPPFPGSEVGDSQAKIESYKEQNRIALKLIAERPDIEDVFVITRGAYYLTGTEPIEEASPVKRPTISVNRFRDALQLVVNTLSRSGKRVYYVTENPELNFFPKSCLPRPLRTGTARCEVPADALRDRQADYYRLLSEVERIKLIDSSTVFCARTCKVLSEDGRMLYADSDHLSVSGSVFQAKNLLGKYLDKIITMDF